MERRNPAPVLTSGALLLGETVTNPASSRVLRAAEQSQARAGNCSRPRLLPVKSGGVRAFPCQDRRFEVCPSCAGLWRAARIALEAQASADHEGVSLDYTASAPPAFRRNRQSRRLWNKGASRLFSNGVRVLRRHFGAVQYSRNSEVSKDETLHFHGRFLVPHVAGLTAEEIAQEVTRILRASRTASGDGRHLRFGEVLVRVLESAESSEAWAKYCHKRVERVPMALAEGVRSVWVYSRGFSRQSVAEVRRALAHAFYVRT